MVGLTNRKVFMKSLLLLVLAFTATTSSAAPAAKSAPQLQGHYSTPTYVVDMETTTKKSCVAKKGQWNGECYMPTENTVSVYKIAGTANQYFVTINVVSSRLNLCDVAENFTRVGNTLRFTAEDKSTLRLSRRGNKIVVTDNNYSISNCGHNAHVGGEYTRKRSAGEVDAIDIADIKECGFKGCLN